jgi:hypothetical protein
VMNAGIEEGYGVVFCNVELVSPLGIGLHSASERDADWIKARVFKHFRDTATDATGIDD